MKIRALTLVGLLCHDFANGRENDANVSVTRQSLQGVIVGVPKTNPFSKPPNVLASNATGRLLANPKISMLIPVPASPVSRTGLRPILSLSQPQNMLAENSAMANADVTIPA